MKLLFDQNISQRILKKLPETYSGSSHVKTEGLLNASDLEIWEYANFHQFIIVTLDSDFNDIFLLNGFSPKILWFRTLNLRSEELSFILINQQSDIQDFINSDDLGCLEFSKTNI